jgi:hypothetical protein
MEPKIIDLSDFQKDNRFYGEIFLLLTVKSFELQEIRKRYLESKKRRDGITGSVSRREPGLGGLVSLGIKNGKIIAPEVLMKMKEPRGISRKNGSFGIASDKYLFTFSDQKISTLKNPWFSYIHTLDFGVGAKDLLVSSSGFDCIFIFSKDSFEKKFEWFAWENGFPRSQKKGEKGESIYLTRFESQAKEWIEQGKSFIYVDKPTENGLPTAKRAAFINSAHFSGPGKVSLTFFHLGEVKELDISSGKLETKITGLRNPHGGRKFGSGYMATSTGDGRVVICSENEQNEFLFGSLPGKPDELEGHEWVQNSITYDDIIISIDSNRTSFIIFHPKKKLLDVVPYDPDWAIQDLVLGELDQEEKELIRSIE